MVGSAPRSRLDADDVQELLGSLEAAFRIHEAELDALNVFPVPDGDTGANMLGTIVAAAEDTSSVAAAVHGAVVGARGNSGVILSQALRSLLESLDDGLTGDTLPAMLERADTLARAAVAEPLEGTMLTALRAAADAADRPGELADRLAGLLPVLAEAVAETEFVLEANRAAGVVDAGARGIEVWLRALHDHVMGVGPTPSAEPSDMRVPDPLVDREDDEPPVREQGSPEYRWEVQYLLGQLREPDDVAVTTLQRALMGIGDSVVVVSAGDLLNVHVHTNQIGAAVEAGLALGHPRRVTVTDFEAAVPDADDAAVGVDVGLVVVLPGAVLADVAAGPAVAVVDGRSGQLPAVGDLLSAAGRTRASRVIVLPGHRNVVPTARQAAGTGDRHVTVVADADALPRALAALAVWDPDAPADDTATAMSAAAAHVRHGEIVAAVRDASTRVGDVSEGDLLGLVDDEVVTVGTDAATVTDVVLGALVADGGELLTVVAGATAPPGEREQVVGHARALGVELEVFVTDAEPSRYWFGLE